MSVSRKDSHCLPESRFDDAGIHPQIAELQLWGHRIRKSPVRENHKHNLWQVANLEDPSGSTQVHVLQTKQLSRQFCSSTYTQKPRGDSPSPENTSDSLVHCSKDGISSSWNWHLSVDWRLSVNVMIKSPYVHLSHQRRVFFWYWPGWRNLSGCFSSFALPLTPPLCSSSDSRCLKLMSGEGW